MNKKILIIGPRWMGDMVMLHGLIHLLHEAEGSPVIDVLAPPDSFALLGRMPGVRRAIPTAFERRGLNLKKRIKQGRALASEAYNQAIIWPSSWKAALVPWVAKIPVRTGWLGEQRYGLINDIRPLDKARFNSMMSRFVTLTHHAPDPLYAVPHPVLRSDSTQACLLAKRHALPDKRLLILCPGTAKGEVKRWPEAYFSALAVHYHRAGWAVVLMGAPSDAQVGGTIEKMALEKQTPVFNLIGQTTVLEAIDLLSLGTVIVANDSGLMHAAAAVGKPVVAIYGPTSKTFAPPLSQHAVSLSLDLACQPCRQPVCPLKHHHCMTQLMPSQAISAIEQLTPPLK